jgi:hypothetical protein
MSNPNAGTGTYSLQVPVSTGCVLSVGEADGGSDNEVEVNSARFNVSSNLKEDVKVPSLAPVDVNVVDASNQPVANAQVSVAYESSTNGATAQGLPLSFTGYTDLTCTTGTGHACVLNGLVGASDTLSIALPYEMSPTSATVVLSANPTNATVHVPNPPPLFTIAGTLTGALAQYDVSISCPGFPTQSSASSSAGSGHYSLQVPSSTGCVLGASESDSGSVNQVNASSAPFDVSSNMAEDLTLPSLATLNVSVVDAAAQPVANARVSVNTESSTHGSTVQGLSLSFTGYSSHVCVTTDSKPCAFTGLVGASDTLSVGLSYETNPVIASAALTGNPTNTTVQVPTAPPLYTISGTVTGSLAQFSVSINCPGFPMQSMSNTSAGSGTFSLDVAAGTNCILTVGESDATQSNEVNASSVPFNVSSDMQENVALPSLALLNIQVADASAQQIGFAQVSVVSETSVGGSSSEGLTMSFMGYTDQTCVTYLTAPCDLTGLVGATDTLSIGVSSQLAPATATVSFTGTSGVASVSIPNISVIRDPNGSVLIESPAGTTLTRTGDVPTSGALPKRAIPLTGSLAYTVSGLNPGAHTSVQLQLPPTDDPTAIYKLVNHVYVDMTGLATIRYNVVTLKLTDGGFGDIDGKANGQVVDPLVPVAGVSGRSTVILRLHAKRLGGGRTLLAASATTAHRGVPFTVDLLAAGKKVGAIKLESGGSTTQLMVKRSVGPFFLRFAGNRVYRPTCSVPVSR